MRTYYGVTNERVIVRITGPFLRQTRSLNLRTLSELALTEGRNGGGTISFRATPFGGYFTSGGLPGSGAYGIPSFELEKGARDVYEIIRKEQWEAQRAA